jgi:hypothetical protein
VAFALLAGHDGKRRHVFVPVSEGHHGRDVGLRRAVLQVLIEERPQDLAPERERRVAVEADRAERAAVVDLLAVVPRAHHQEHLVVRRVLRLDRLHTAGAP